MNEHVWREIIASQVRQWCTPGPEAYKAGGDTLIAAVADWIEKPPGWVAPVVVTPGEEATPTAWEQMLADDARALRKLRKNTPVEE